VSASGKEREPVGETVELLCAGVPVAVTLGPVIAEGGSAIVHEARRPAGEPLVVKRVRAGAERLLDLEKRACEHVDHPNVVRYLGSGRSSALGMVLAFERLSANPLLTLNAAGNRPRFRDPGTLYYPLPPGVALELGSHLIEAIAHLHARGLVHGDVKLANFMVRTPSPDAPPRAILVDLARGAFDGVLIDLGCARSPEFLDLVARGEMSPELAPGCTPIYSPPEAFREREAAGRPVAVSRGADVYAFGLVFYALLTGRAPYDASGTPPGPNEVEELIGLKLREARRELTPQDDAALDAIPLHDVAFRGGVRAGWPSFRSGVAHLLRRCLDPDPDRRIDAATAAAFFAQELRVRHETGSARPRGEGFFQMRPLANRLTGDGCLGGIRVSDVAGELVGTEAPPPAPAPSEPGPRITATAAASAPDDAPLAFADSVEAAAAGLLRETSPEGARGPGGVVPLGHLLKELQAKRPLPVRGPVLVTTTSLDPRELARASLLSLGDRARGARSGVRVSVGRGEGNDLPIPCASVSKEHLALELDRDGWWIGDLGSVNGTWLDGKRVPDDQKRRVTGGFAVIRLGTARLAFLAQRELEEYLEHALDMVLQAHGHQARGHRAVPPPRPVATARPGAVTRRVPRITESDLVERTDLALLFERLRSHPSGTGTRFFVTFEGGAVHVLGSAEETARVASGSASRVMAVEATVPGGEPVKIFDQRGAVA
jgi:serine/threonine protein kinase